MADEPKAAAPQGQQQQVALQVDLSKMETVYCNFFRLTLGGGGQEDVLLDIGLQSGVMMQPGPQPVMEPIQMTHRLVMNPFVAKRLLESLRYIVSRYEQAFGVLELDMLKRLRTGQKPAGA